jgi:hypothetical protein
MGEPTNGRNGQPSQPSPRERYEEFAQDNERWNHKVDEALQEWDAVIEGDDNDAPSREPAGR